MENVAPTGSRSGLEVLDTFFRAGWRILGLLGGTAPTALRLGPLCCRYVGRFPLRRLPRLLSSDEGRGATWMPTGGEFQVTG